MSRLALITLSDEGARVVDRLSRAFAGSERFLHTGVSAEWHGMRFERIVDRTREIFDRFDGVVFVAPCGVVVRAVADRIKHKTVDPAVVVVDVGARFAVSLLSGHEGGANDLAISVANALGAEPVISTTTEALKTTIVGIGCRKGVSSERIVAAIREALETAKMGMDDVRLLATADVKAGEPGLLDAARDLGIPLRIIPSEEIRASRGRFESSAFVESRVNLPAVAEPAALLAGRRTRLALPKTAFDGITIAIAREESWWLALDREAP